MRRALLGPVLLALALRLVAVLATDRVVADVERYQRVAVHLLDVSWNPYETRRLYPYPPPWAAAEASSCRLAVLMRRSSRTISGTARLLHCSNQAKPK